LHSEPGVEKKTAVLFIIELKSSPIDPITGVDWGRIDTHDQVKH